MSEGYHAALRAPEPTYTLRAHESSHLGLRVLARVLAFRLLPQPAMPLGELRGRVRRGLRRHRERLWLWLRGAAVDRGLPRREAIRLPVHYHGSAQRAERGDPLLADGAVRRPARLAPCQPVPGRPRLMVDGASKSAATTGTPRSHRVDTADHRGGARRSSPSAQRSPRRRSATDMRTRAGTPPPLHVEDGLRHERGECWAVRMRTSGQSAMCLV
jgi:hypothetical protein